SHEAKPLASVNVPAQRFPPGLIFQIPADGVLEAAIKFHARSPAELTACFGCINSVPPVMARAIGNKGYKCFSRPRNRNDRIENAADPLGNLQIRVLGAATEIVFFAGTSAT